MIDWAQGALASTNKYLAQMSKSPRWLRAFSKKCIWTRELRKSFKEVFGLTSEEALVKG